MNKIFHADIFKQLLLAKLVNIRSVLIEKIINIYIWAGCTIFVMGYLMQSFGLAKNFGPFQLAGILAVVGLFELYGNAAILVADIEGDRTLAYYLTLPSSMFTILLSYVLHFLIVSMSMSLALLPLGKLMLWNQFSITNIAWIKWFMFTLLINSVWVILAFVLASYIPNIDKLGLIWCRVIFPLWFLGGFQFSWTATHSVSPILSYIMLLNPVIYATEGVRATLIGQEECLPYWLCFIIITGICFITGWWAIKALKRRLDLV